MAVACDCAAHGCDVRLLDSPEFPDNIAAVESKNGMAASGEVLGFATIVSAGYDIDEALQDAKRVYVAGPPHSTEPFGKAVAGRLHEGQNVW